MMHVTPLIETAVPVEDMCGSLMNMGTSLTTTSIGTFGECTVPSDCLSLNCLGLKLVVIPGVIVIDYNSSVTLLPCQTPFEVVSRSTNGNNTIVDGVFTNNTILSLYDPTMDITTTLIAEIDQKPYGVTTSVRITQYTRHSNYLLNTYNMLVHLLHVYIHMCTYCFYTLESLIHCTHAPVVH